MRRQLVIADDEVGFRTLVRKIATAKDWDVVECTNGAELLNVLPSVSADAVLIVDIMMPEVDGIEAISKLAEKLNGQPVYFVTGGLSVYADIAQHISKSRGVNFQAVLRKPLSLMSISSIIEAH